MINRIIHIIRDTLFLQPVVIFYSLTAIGTKTASKMLPTQYRGVQDFFWQCLTNIWLLLTVFGIMFCLVLYAVIWQQIIRKRNIAVVYANKSSNIFWTQLAAVFIFGECISISNIIGIIIIFTGVIIGNSDVMES